MQEIPLSKGQVALVNDSDYGWLSQYSWHCLPADHGRLMYARTCIKLDGKYVGVPMHRMIMKAQKGDLIDHINRDGLDNRRENLRFANKSINNFNGLPRSDNTSGVRGVSWSKQKRSWVAYIKLEQKRIHLGLYYTKEEAIAARRAAERLYNVLVP